MEEGNILTVKKSRTCTKKMTNDYLFKYFDELLEAQGTGSCRNINCGSLNMLKDDRVCATVAKLFAGFEQKNKHEQDRIVLDWHKYAEATRDWHREIWYCLPYDGTWCTDMEEAWSSEKIH